MQAERALLLLGLLPATARAYTLNGSTWTWQGTAIDDPFHVAPDSFAADGVDPSELLDAVDAAMLTWNEAGYDLQLARGDDVADPVQSPEGSFELFQGADTETGITLAYTAVWGYEDGLAFDCDVLFLDADDDGDIVWSADPDGPPEGAWDVQSVALHELGHCLGLSHSTDEGAIMYAHYSGRRTLSADDLSGLASLYDPTCADADGDGVSACAGDCADDNALISPRADELCDGVDDNCDGVVDEAEGLTVSVGNDRYDADWSQLSVGNGFRVDASTTLRGVRQRWDGPAGARLVWSVSRQDGRSWTIIREIRGEAVTGGWQTSPPLDLPLEAGQTYAVVLGTVSDGVTMYYQKSPSLAANGPLTPLGSLYGRAIGDQLTSPDDRYLVDQELTLSSGVEGDGCPEETGSPPDTGQQETGGADSAETADSATDTGGAAPKGGCTCAVGDGRAAPLPGLALAAALTLARRRRGSMRQSRSWSRLSSRSPSLSTRSHA